MSCQTGTGECLYVIHVSTCVCVIDLAPMSNEYTIILYELTLETSFHFTL